MGNGSKDLCRVASLAGGENAKLSYLSRWGIAHINIIFIPRWFKRCFGTVKFVGSAFGLVLENV